MRYPTEEGVRGGKEERLSTIEYLSDFSDFIRVRTHDALGRKRKERREFDRRDRGESEMRNRRKKRFAKKQE